MAPGLAGGAVQRLGPVRGDPEAVERRPQGLDVCFVEVPRELLLDRGTVPVVGLLEPAEALRFQDDIYPAPVFG